jgi:murein endopeptidase
MKSLSLSLSLALALLTIAGGAEAKGKHKASHPTHAPRSHAAARATMSKSSKSEALLRARKHAAAAPRPMMPHFDGPVSGQSLGYPWSGRLQDATQLPEGDGYVIRRPSRAFGTQTTVDIVQRVLGTVRDEFPETHILAIGDISAEHGGPITQHASHQAGRDIDVGLYYVEKPADYPENFEQATEANLDAEATYAVIDNFAKTTHEDGGVLVIFLDYQVQGILVRWAREHGVDEDHLHRLFEYPNGRGTGALVRHIPNHANHMHVRFKCPDDDAGCR